MKNLYILIISFLISASALSQTTTQLNHLDTYYNKSLKERHIPGMAIAIVKDDHIIFSKGYGYANITKKTKVDANTLFAIASNTKAFTASSLAQLVDAKKIKWTDNVVSYLPYFKMYNKYVTQAFTIEDLLSHRSGLKTFSGDLLWYGSNLPIKNIIANQQYLKPVYGFRTHFGYSNIAYLAAGQILEKVTHTTWSNYVKSHFLTPLGMKRTITSTNDIKNTTNVATPYFYRNGKNHPLNWVNWDNVQPVGGLISSVNDYAQWLKLNLHKGTLNGKVYFSKKQWANLTTPHVPIKVGKNGEKIHFKSYGMGWFLQDYQGYKIIFHGGGYDGMISKSFYVPEKNIGIIILTNSLNWLPSALMNKTLDVLLTNNLNGKDWSAKYLSIKQKRDSIASVKLAYSESLRNKINPNHKQFKDYIGTYKDKAYGTVTVSIKNNNLFFSMDNTPIYYANLNHWNGDIFTFRFNTKLSSLPQGKLWFDTNDIGRISKLHINVPNPDFDFTEFEFLKLK